MRVLFSTWGRLFHAKIGGVLVLGVLCWGALGRGDNPAADVNFHGTEIPSPPANKETWATPKEPVQLAKLTELFYGLGMADPRGLEYRQVKVMTGNVWGNYDNGKWSTDGMAIQTHGWVLPADDKNSQRFAVCWNGWVYPVLAVGDTCSVDDDVQKQLKPLDKDDKKEGFQRGLWSYSEAVGDYPALSFETPVSLKVLLLMRLGKTELASALWESFYKDPNRPDSGAPKDLDVAFHNVATMWLFSLFNRAVCAQMRGDDDLALVSFRQLAAITPEVQKTYDSLRDPAKKPAPNEEPPFDFLKEVPKYLADMDRRCKEAPRKSALELGRDKFPDKTAWIKALIDDLENVQAQQDGQPGWVRLDQNETVKALVTEGNDAVEPLIDCLEHDDRYTRSVHFWRDFAPYRTILGADEAAYTALTGILKTTFFDIRSTGQDLTNSGPEARAKVVADIRAYWQKRKGSSVEDQWFVTLADDNAKPEEWAAAAGNIVKSGQSLREKKNPSVAELLEKRIKGLSKQDMGSSWRPAAAPQLADALLTWGGADEADKVREFCEAMAGRYGVEKETDGLTRPLIALTMRLEGMGDKKILDDYAGWLKTVPPEKVGDFQVIRQWFRPLWDNQDNEVMQKTATFIFTNPYSLWVAFFHEKQGTNEGVALLRSPLLGVKGFREMVLKGLADQSQAGESGYLVGNFWMVRYGTGNQANQVMASLNPLDPMSKLAPGHDTYRVCDLYAWAIAGTNAGLPTLQFYWPVKKRDEAIAQAMETLQRYGDRYEVSAMNPAKVDFAIGGTDGYVASLYFPPLDHPATAEDVQKGLAIFSLPEDEKARVWMMPKPGAKARWLAIKDFSHNAGHSDSTGRQWMTTDFDNEGRVWQTEEGFAEGKWQRYFGFTGNHVIARAPAEEIEFPSRWPWQELDKGFDVQLASDNNYFKNPWHPGTPFPLTLKLRNRRGVNQDGPESLYQADNKALAMGVNLHLYRKKVPEAGQIVKDPAAGAKAKTDWEEVPVKEGGRFDLPAEGHPFAPMDELQVMTGDMNDFYDLTQPGEYYLEMTFDSEKVKFAGGTSNYLQFQIK